MLTRLDFHRTIALLILWPLPIYGSRYVFSQSFFTGWVVVAIIWIFISLALVGIYPLWEGRHTIMRTLKAITKGGEPPVGGIIVQGVPESTSASGTATPTKKGDQ